MTPSSIGTPWQRRVRAAVILTAAASGLSFLACAGDGPTAVPELDLAQSTLVVAAGPYVAGQTYTATLTARNSKGEPFTDPISATLSLVNGTSGGTFSPITSTGTGTYSSTLTAITAGTPSQVRATIAGEGELTSTQSITIVPGPASAATSLVTASLTSVPVGGASTVTVTARDANNNVRTSGGDAVVIGLNATAPGGGQLGDGTLSAVTDLGNGTYTATFTGTRWGVRAITASINGSAITGALPAITVQMPPPSTAQSTIVLGRASLAAGDTTTVLLELRDPQGNRVTWTGVTVTFTKGAGTSDGTFGAVVDRGDGTYGSLFTATTAGSARAIGATISGAPVTSPSPTVTVIPGALSLLRSAVTVGADTLTAGAQTTLTLTARDGQGNQLGEGGLAVTFTKGAGTSDGVIGAVTDHGNGTYTASFTATTSGTARSIGATIGGAAVTSAAPGITVRAGALSLANTTLTAGATTLVSGAQTTLTVTARDAAGNAITTGGATVALAKGAGTSDGTLSAVTDQGDGSYVATFTATTAGTALTISATVGGAALTSPAIAITVTPGAASVATSTLAISRSTLLIGDTATLELTARDAAGNLVGAGGATVAFTKGAGSSDGTIGAVADLGDGRYRATFTATTAGSARAIGATIGGAALTMPSVSVTVSSVPPSLALSAVTVGAATVASGNTTTLTLTVRDSAGAVIASGGRTVTFTLGDGTSTGTISATTDQGDGTYTATFTGVLTGSPRAIGATIDGQPVTSAAPTITVTPGAASVATSTLAVGSTSLASGAQTDVTLATRDAAGNALTSGGLAVTFTLGAGTSGGTLSAVTDQGDGTYRATFTATVAGSARTIGATIAGVPLSSALPTITVTAGAPSLTRSGVTVANATLASGDSTTLALVVRDAQGNILGGGLTVAFTKGAGSSDGVIGAVTDVGDGSYRATFRATTAGSARTIGATIGGEAITPDTVATVTVTPGAISPDSSSLTVGSSTVIAGDTTSVVLTARDAAGNLIGAGGASVLFTKGAGTSDGTFDAMIDRGDGTYASVFTATTAGSARTIGATANGATLSSPLPTVTVIPGARSLLRSTVTVAADTLAAGAQTTLTLTVRDALGNQLGAGGLTVAFTKGAGTSDGTIGAVTDHGDGTYTASFTATTSGTARSIGATIGGEALASAAPTITVTAGALSLATSTLTAGATTLVSGAQTTLTVTARDAAGNAITTGGATVALVKGAGTSDGTLGAVTDQGDGTYVATFTATTAGTALTISATVGGEALTSPAPAITVTPGAASVATSTLAVGAGTLASGAETVVTLTTRDAAGNALTSGGLTVTFTLGAGTAGGTLSAVTDQGDGTYRATFTATVAGSARTIGATIDGATLTSTLPSIAVTAGALSLVRSRVQVGSDTLASGDSTTLTLLVRDAAGNLLGAGGLTVAFVKGDGTSDGEIGAVTDVGDGTYRARFRATTAGTARTIGATIGGEAITPDTVARITVRAGAISPETSTLTIGSDTVIAGDTTSIVLTARDAAGNLVGAGGATVVFTKGSGTADGAISEVTDVGDGTYRAVFTALTTGTARAIGVTIAGAAGTMPSPTVVVRPGRFSLARSSMIPNRDTLRRLDTLSVVLVARDSLGNAHDRGGLNVRWGYVEKPLVPGATICSGTVPPVMLDNGDGTYRSAPDAGIRVGQTGVLALLVWVQGEPGFDANCTLVYTRDSVVVRPAAGAASTSSVVAAPRLLEVGDTSTVTVTVRDSEFFSTLGGDTVVIVADSATANGTVSPVVDRGDGTYTARFIANAPGGPRSIRVLVNGDTIPLYTSQTEILVIAPVPDLALSTDSVGLLAQQGTTGPAVLVAVANAGTGAIGGLATTQAHVSGPGTCATQNWLLTPTFDKGGIADPVSVMTLQANAAGLELGVCVRRVVVTSTTPGVQPETLLVALDVGRNPVATGLVNVVMMGDASSNTVQTIAPTPVLRIDNGGRGTVSNLTAQIVSQTGFAECVDPFDEATCVPWLAPGDLVFSSPTLPSTLSIVSQVRPFSATARVRVAGTGMPARDFDINVVFNVLPELVTNPRAAIFRAHRSACCGGPQEVTDTLIALNQNTAHPGLTNYRVDPNTPLPDGWSVQVTPLGNSARVIITAAVFYQPDDTTVTSSGLWYSPGIGNGVGEGMHTGGIRILADCTNANDCFDFGADSVVPKSFEIPWTVQTARGLALSLDTLEITARDTTTQVIDVPITNLGPGVIEDLRIDGGPGVGGWVEAQIVGGTTTPAVLRLTVRPSRSEPTPEQWSGVQLSGRSLFVTGQDGNRQDVSLVILFHRRFP